MLCLNVSPFSRGGDSRDVKKPSRVPRYQKGLKVVGFCDFQVKPLPWRGHRGLGYRLKPLLMKKGLGLMEELQVSLHSCAKESKEYGFWGIPQ